MKKGTIMYGIRTTLETRDLVSGLDEFVLGYLEAALWTSHAFNDPNGQDDRTFSDIGIGIDSLTREALVSAIEDCNVFRRLMIAPLYHAEKVRPLDHLGHDFWLTRCGHGTGFWDRTEIDDWSREKLTELSRVFGDSDLYAGDDGYLHFSP